MNCPKCGAAQQASREECASCGVIFSRWQPRTTRPGQVPNPVDVDESSTGIPTWAVVAGVVLFVVFGLWWTKRHNEKVANANLQAAGDAQLDEINQKGNQARARLAQEAANAQRLESERASRPRQAAPLPSDLDENAVRMMIQNCSHFQERVTVKIPKTFDRNQYRFVNHSYPAFLAAESEHLIEFDPPLHPAPGSLPDSGPVSDTINVRIVPFAYSKVEVIDAGETYEFGLGRRVLENFSYLEPQSDSAVIAGFKWKYEQTSGNALGPESSHDGGADLKRTGSGWEARRIWVATQDASRTVCGAPI
jgi:hypothetical protein